MQIKGNAIWERENEKCAMETDELEERTRK